jgi:Tir chaperone family protein CesT
MTYEEMLRHLGASLGIAALAAWPADECELTIDGMAVRLRHLREARQIEIEAQLPHASPLAWDAAAAMLADNFIGASAPDAICNIGPDGVARLCMRQWLEPLSGEDFADSLARFVARLERHLRLSATSPAATAASPQWHAV